MTDRETNGRQLRSLKIQSQHNVSNGTEPEVSSILTVDRFLFHQYVVALNVMRYAERHTTAQNKLKFHKDKLRMTYLTLFRH